MRRSLIVTFVTAFIVVGSLPMLVSDGFSNTPQAFEPALEFHYDEDMTPVITVVGLPAISRSGKMIAHYRIANDFESYHHAFRLDKVEGTSWKTAVPHIESLSPLRGFDLDGESSNKELEGWVKNVNARLRQEQWLPLTEVKLRAADKATANDNENRVIVNKKEGALVLGDVQFINNKGSLRIKVEANEIFDNALDLNTGISVVGDKRYRLTGGGMKCPTGLKLLSAHEDHASVYFSPEHQLMSVFIEYFQHGPHDPCYRHFPEGFALYSLAPEHRESVVKWAGRAHELIAQTRSYATKKRFDAARKTVKRLRTISKQHPAAAMLDAEITKAEKAAFALKLEKEESERRQRKFARELRAKKQRLNKMRQNLPSFIRACEEEATRNIAAKQAIERAATRGLPGAVKTHTRRLNTSYQRGCKASQSAWAVYRSYQQSGDSIAAKAVYRGIRFCRNSWKSCSK